MVKRAAPKIWAPDRQDVIWIDCNPQRGQEMRDVHPFLVLSPKTFNQRTSLVIGLPMTTADYNADNPFAVNVGLAGGRKAGQTSYVLCHQPKSFDWRIRGGAPHPMKKVSDAPFAEVLALLNQIIQLT
jgi:mRNA interferase MazF